MRHRQLAKLIAIACLASLSWAGVAEATFPGANGSIFSTRTEGDGRFMATTATVIAVAPRNGRERSVYSCQSSGGFDSESRVCRLSRPAVSPDGREVAVMRTDIYSKSPSTYRETRSLVRFSISGRHLATVETPVAGDPVWAPDGKSLLVAGAQDRLAQPVSGLPVLRLDGTLRRTVANGVIASADWSARRTVVLERLGELFVLRRDGSARRIGSGSAPSWSPSGRSIAFAGRPRRLRDQPNVVTTRANGTRRRAITRRGGNDPVWSPDGKQIAFLRDDGAIHVARIGRRGTRRIGTGCLGLCGSFVGEWGALGAR